MNDVRPLPGLPQLCRSVASVEQGVSSRDTADLHEHSSGGKTATLRVLERDCVSIVLLDQTRVGIGWMTGLIVLRENALTTFEKSTWDIFY